MSSKRHFHFINCRNIVPIILASAGIGMLAVILLPVWLWIVFFGVALIAYAWYILSGH